MAASSAARCGGLALIVLLAACAPTPTPEAVPTSVLIPATETLTPTPEPPTATPQTLTSPEDLIPPSATFAPRPEATGELLAVDPVAAALVNVARRELAGRRNLPERRITLVSVEQVVWPDTSLGCPRPDIQYALGPIDGYRIVLEAGGQQTLYHTDFDRVFVCAEGDEVLPGTPAAEATAAAN